MHNEIKQTRVMIGIQARSTSKRLPGKVYATLGNKSILKNVIDSVVNSTIYLNDNDGRFGLHVQFCLLVPTGDKIVKDFRTKCFEGSETDVLSRYKKMSDAVKADYYVRITADCPLIPSPVITRIIKLGVKNSYDYLANFFEKDGKLFRLVPDGYECEFFSREMLEWACANASTDSHREHVTTIMRTYPEWGNYGVLIPWGNTGDKKLSVDTLEDLERAQKEWETVDEAKREAEGLFGQGRAHRY